MLDLKRVQLLLSLVEYRPGWTISAHWGEFGSGVWVYIDGPLQDADDPDRIIRVGVRAVVPTEYLSDGSSFLNWLQKRLIRVEAHEFREFFKVSGQPWDSPHKVRQSKHDYHVRKVDGKWRVYHGDAPDPQLDGNATMAEAHRRARYYVWRDDLYKGETYD